MKVRLNALGDEIFYYPDVMVGCDPRDTHRLYLQYPKLIVEVASESTERLDRTEKRMAYQTIAPLEEYFIISQDRVQVIAFRRSNRWNPEAFTDPNQKVGFNSIGASLFLSVIYAGVSVRP